ncbi:MAG: CotH kinase family protein, partial [Bacteroidota bacterium]
MKTCWLIILLVCCSSWVVAQSDFYATDEIQTIEIEFEQSNWRVLLDSLKANNAEARLEATVHINGQKFNRAGIRFKGNSSYNSALRDGLIKLPFNIKLDYFDRSANYQGYQTIKLANGFRDPSMVREVLAYEIAREYMAAPKANFAKVYVNDAYYGLYTNTESIDRSFLKEHFGDKNGAFFKCDPDYHAEPLPDCRADQKSDLTYHGNDSICYLDNYERKSNNISDWNNLIRLTRRLNHHPKKLEDILDIDAALKMLAFNNLIVNLD